MCRNKDAAVSNRRVSGQYGLVLAFYVNGPGVAHQVDHLKHKPASKQNTKAETPPPPHLKKGFPLGTPSKRSNWHRMSEAGDTQGVFGGVDQEQWLQSSSTKQLQRPGEDFAPPRE